MASVISSSPRGLGADRAGRVVDRRREHVDAHEREVGLRLGRLLGEPDDAPVLELGDAVVLRVVDRREQDQRARGVLAERLDEAVDPALQQVVAEVHHERRIAEERLGRQHRVGQAGRLVLDDVGQLHAEPRAVAGRRADLVAGLRGDDDPDLLDPRLGHRVDAVEEHRPVGDGHELLGVRVRDRAQARAAPARQDQALQRFHGRLVNAVELAVVPRRPAGLDELHRDPLGRLLLDHRAHVVVHAAVAREQLEPERGRSSRRRRGRPCRTRASRRAAPRSARPPRPGASREGRGRGSRPSGTWRTSTPTVRARRRRRWGGPRTRAA